MKINIVYIVISRREGCDNTHNYIVGSSQNEKKAHTSMSLAESKKYCETHFSHSYNSDYIK